MTALPVESELPLESALSVESDALIEVCSADAVTPDRGIAALIDGEPVAIFRLSPIDGADEEWYALDHIDPRTGAPVIARGLVGSAVVDGRTIPTVASPLYKQRYDLTTGRGIDGEMSSLRTWDVRIIDGRVHVGARSSSA